MRNFVNFLASKSGRILRAVLGIAAFYAGLFMANGFLAIVLFVLAGLFYLGALMDICLFGLFTDSTINGSKITKSKDSSTPITIIILVLGLISFSLIGIKWNNDKTEEIPTPLQTSSNVITSTQQENTTAEPASSVNSQEELLLYLIEEEKLAHDVYTVMYQTYGAKVFGNILKSEESHQSQVLTLLNARNIADPRSSELGKFTNTDLQSLYDQLIAQGKQSEQEAYKVGVIIEEKDIADITKQLETAYDSDTVSTLEILRSGSENHLRAFNKQLGI